MLDYKIINLMKIKLNFLKNMIKIISFKIRLAHCSKE